MKKINEKDSFLKSNLEKNFLIKIIYIETMMFLKNKDNINKIKEFFIVMFFSIYLNIYNLIKNISIYENNLFLKQILFFIIIMKYLLFLIIKKIFFSSFNYFVLFIKFDEKPNLENKDILDSSSQNNFLKNIYNNLNFMFDDIIFFISTIIYEF